MELPARAAAGGNGAQNALQESIVTGQAAVALLTPTRSRTKQRPDPVIHRIDTRPLDFGVDEIVAVGKLRNEMLRLPDFLRHHRRLGVGRFLAIDDRSDDGTRAFLLDQPDVHVFEIREPFAESSGGARWTSAVLDQFAPGRWALTLDADELFVYPGCERFDLRWLCRYLESTGADCMTAEMVDMYPRWLGGPERYHAGESLIAFSPYFDSDTYVKRRRRGFPTNYLVGGARARLFYDEPMPPKIALYDALVQLLEPYGLARLLPAVNITRWQPPLLTKVPLARWSPGRRYIAAGHLMAPPGKASDVTGALLHFKFLHDFTDKVAIAVREGNYYLGSVEYQRYAERLDQNPSFELIYPNSLIYQSSDDLVRCGLMRLSPAYQAATRQP
ncbi:glycosyltransferase family 2 protein [Bradyrhizobium sp. 180]|uniref:glycosyltransferase family 2 protein n=1 Tax=unclassified Bradyrhizobium TaxID=2631580 RepID=UPI001FFB2F20|nr:MULTISPECIES: glycosyltransferase family 2 protein [unclassified Bradyrhizobium]MCK1423154.1 glycosyltransferase family 2 protein [Bradyrhizobium sp. CW12]MCK1492974.1 glycosyltransferase family 2 protein [Bradyrhizobium sp. 180]MCK1531277.1 glycosyltransferase family 2 protein [Bradyrhizobium sp. 182]MCK1599140.1 glycosyltransferase family 2 protein [Bradyrhizobium sp. 164]MCK1645088.1 glycosyltransferase family 2 protein [Bradyrhizobium sp. 154]